MDLPTEPAVDFEAIFEAAPGMFMVVQATEGYPVVAVSEGYVRHMGIPREKLVGARLFEIAPRNPDDPAGANLAAWRASFEKVRASLAADTITRQRWDLRAPDGDGYAERYWTIVNSPVLAPDGALRFIVRRIEDVTAQVVSERQFEDTRSRLEATLAAAEIGTWIWHVEPNRVFADRNLACLFGVSQEEANGGPIESYLRAIHPDDRGRVNAEIARSIQEGRAFDLEYRLLHADGAERWVVARGRAERDASGKPVRFPGVVVDITGRRRAEDALRESDERVRLAVESADLGTWDYSPLSGELTWSDQCRAMFGVRPGVAITFQTFVDTLQPSMRDRIAAAVSGVLQPGSDGSFHEEMLVVGMDGVERWVASRGRVFFGEDGKPRRFIGTVIDITRRKQAEAAALRRTAQLQSLASISSRLNAAHDVGSVVGIMTAEARHLLGAREAAFQPDGVWDKAVGESLSAPLLDRQGQVLGAVRLSGKETGEFVEDDAALLNQLAQIAAGAIEGARLYQELRANDQRKDEFLAMLAHELRNPLAAMRNAVDLGHGGDATPEELRWSGEVLNRQLGHLTRLIDDLLDVSRVTRGKIDLRRAPIDAAVVLRHAVEAVAPLFAERSQELTVSLRPGDLPLHADSARLEQVVVNLLANAAKYTPNGGCIVLEARREGAEIVVSVRDTGRGIPADKLGGVFELFAQGDRTLARSEGGLGVGLTIARSLTEMHGGSVQAFSEGAGRGSEFVVRLPAASPVPPLSEAGMAAPLPEGPRSLSPARVLVVDDNVDAALVTARMLRRVGLNVRTVHDGPAALQAAREHQAEYVLLDIGLPGMDGYEVAQRLREDETLRGVVIIAVSGYGQEEDRRRSRKSGFDQHLVKPVEFESLLAALTGSLAPSSETPSRARP